MMDHATYTENWGILETGTGCSKYVEDSEGVQPPTTKANFTFQVQLQQSIREIFLRQFENCGQMFQIVDRDENTLHFVCQVQY